MDNDNKRLDELFNQVKSQEPKTSFLETKEQFLNSSVAIKKGTNKVDFAQFTNAKLIIMITTICAITLGAVLYINKTPELKLVENNTVKTNKNSITDSVFIADEHEKVVNEYFEKVIYIEATIPSNDTNKRKLKKRKNKVIDKTWFLEEQDTPETNVIETIENYRFPSLNADDWKDHLKQKSTMFGKVRKKKKQKDPYGFNFIPIGTYLRGAKQISTQAFYMKKTEVTNLEYRTFLFDLLRQNRKADFIIAKPDQTRWVKDYPNAFNKPMQENYFSHPAYDDYPVVGMSREGAEMYCKWFSDELNRVNGGQKMNKVRLPTNYEWEFAAKGGLKDVSYPWGGPYVRNSKGCFLANFRPMKDDFAIDGGFFTVKADSYNPNDYGLYCMSGNVAEMVYDENNKPATKGGSWSSVGQELQIIEGKDRFKGLIKPSVDVGFRPIITYINKNNGGLVGTLGAKAIDINPPGTKKAGHNFFFDETEVTNFMWLEYLNWQERTFGKSSNEYKESLPDSNVWKKNIDYHKPFVTHYFSHPAYNLYPVVGVSYDQAEAYCKWRTDRVKEFYKVKAEKTGATIYPLNFEYRLPTKKEWERVAKIDYSEKTLKKLDSKYKGQSRGNLKRANADNMGVAGKINENANVTAPVNSYWPNSVGAYNVFGNVAEMTLEKGIAKGGSWIHTEEETTVEKDFKYSEPHSWLGFRCVFVEKK